MNSGSCRGSVRVSGVGRGWGSINEKTRGEFAAYIPLYQEALAEFMAVSLKHK